jgi:GH24 family phage-related lysozyme (muramidase)
VWGTAGDGSTLKTIKPSGTRKTEQRKEEEEEEEESATPIQIFIHQCSYTVRLFK